MISDDQCRCRSEETIVTSVDPYEAHSLSDFSYYPNPTEEYLFLNIGDPENGELLIVMHNAVGARVYERTLVKTSERLETQVPMHGLKPGIYHLTVYMHGRRTTVKIARQ